MKVLDAEGDEQEGRNLDAVEVEDSSLDTAFPDVSSLFHPEDETQKILKVTWGGDSRDGTALAVDESWSGIAWMEGINPSNYGILSLYLKHGQTGGTGYINLTDPDGQGIKLTYEPGGTDWEQLKVNLREGTASFSGSSSVSTLAIDGDASELTRFEIGNVRSGLGNPPAGRAPLFRSGLFDSGHSGIHCGIRQTGGYSAYSRGIPDSEELQCVQQGKLLYRGEGLSLFGSLQSGGEPAQKRYRFYEYPSGGRF